MDMQKYLPSIRQIYQHSTRHVPQRKKLKGRHTSVEEVDKDNNKDRKINKAQEHNKAQGNKVPVSKAHLNKHQNNSNHNSNHLVSLPLNSRKVHHSPRTCHHLTLVCSVNHKKQSAGL
jgi:hypothetical protein